jgi:hypothetical protein
MVLRMRTSIEEINRAYLKFYNNPDTLAKVKVEPSQQLLNKASTGQKTTPIIVKNSTIKVKDEPIDEPMAQIQDNTKGTISRYEQKRLNSKVWYENNKEYHKNKVRNANKSPETYKRRYINELQKGLLDFNKMKKETIEKYGIKYDAINNVYS